MPMILITENAIVRPDRLIGANWDPEQQKAYFQTDIGPSYSQNMTEEEWVKKRDELRKYWDKIPHSPKVAPDTEPLF